MLQYILLNNFISYFPIFLLFTLKSTKLFIVSEVYEPHLCLHELCISYCECLFSQSLPGQFYTGCHSIYKSLATEILICCCYFSRVRLCVTPQTSAHQVPPSLGFSRQEHWSGLPFPSAMHESAK